MQFADLTVSLRGNSNVDRNETVEASATPQQQSNPVRIICLVVVMAMFQLGSFVS